MAPRFGRDSRLRIIYGLVSSPRYTWWSIPSNSSKELGLLCGTIGGRIGGGTGGVYGGRFLTYHVFVKETGWSHQEISAMWGLIDNMGIEALPLQLTFWRKGQARVTHRNPLFDAAIGVTPSIMGTDQLHAVNLGVVQKFPTDLVWAMFLNPLWTEKKG